MLSAMPSLSTLLLPGSLNASAQAFFCCSVCTCSPYVKTSNADSRWRLIGPWHSPCASMTADNASGLHTPGASGRASFVLPGAVPFAAGRRPRKAHTA